MLNTLYVGVSRAKGTRQTSDADANVSSDINIVLVQSLYHAKVGDSACSATAKRDNCRS